MIKKIVGVDDPTLRGKAKAVEKIDKKILQLISEMKETLLAQSDPEGVALAAPQVGKNLRIFVVSFDGHELVAINPEIKTRSRKKTRDKDAKKTLEGCLSVPHYYSPIKRAREVTMQYTDEEGVRKTEKFDGFLARVVQHEVDHLDGVLFTDHVLEQKKKIYKYTSDGWEEMDL